jgi:hypothetical protein
MQMTAFWDIALCGLVEIDRHVRGAYCLHHQGSALKVTHFFQTAWCNIPKDFRFVNLISPVFAIGGRGVE